MGSKVAITSALLLAALLAMGVVWIVWDGSPDPSDASEPRRAPEMSGERAHDPERERVTGKPVPNDPSRTGTQRSAATAESEFGRSASARGTDDASRRPGLASLVRAAGSTALDRPVESGRERSAQEFGSFKERLAVLRSAAGETPGAQPDPSELSDEDLDRLDLDADRDVSDWELEMVNQLLTRAERHPVKSDEEDGAYPTERDHYRRSDQEFDFVDSNGDGLLEESEYYAFLLDSLKESILLDQDGDRLVSLEESGFTEDEFGRLDTDDNGQLKLWQIRQAMARGEWPRRLD